MHYYNNNDILDKQVHIKHENHYCLLKTKTNNF